MDTIDDKIEQQKETNISFNNKKYLTSLIGHFGRGLKKGDKVVVTEDYNRIREGEVYEVGDFPGWENERGYRSDPTLPEGKFFGIRNKERYEFLISYKDTDGKDRLTGRIKTNKEKELSDEPLPTVEDIGHILYYGYGYFKLVE